jgi:hypothetical protein
LKASWSKPGITGAIRALAPIIDDLWDSGITKHLDDQGRPIVYGKETGDVLVTSIYTVPNYERQLDKGFVLIGADGNDLLYGDNIGHDLLLGGRGRDELHGQAGVNSLSGGEGNDLIYAYGKIPSLGSISNGTSDSKSYIIAGGGRDMIVGSNGDDLIVGDDLSDSSGSLLDQSKLIDGIREQFPENVLSKLGNGSVDKVFGDTIFGLSGNDMIAGGRGKDTIFGDEAAGGFDDPNTVSAFGGNPGKDSLYGDAEADTIYGGGEADMIFGGDGNDTLYGAFAESMQVTVDASLDNDIICGGAGNDALYGGTGRDILIGDAGNDTFYFKSGGLEEVDVCWGGAGTDRFYLESDAVVAVMRVNPAATVESLKNFDFSAWLAAAWDPEEYTKAEDIDVIIINPDAEDKLIVGTTIFGGEKFVFDGFSDIDGGAWNGSVYAQNGAKSGYYDNTMNLDVFSPGGGSLSIYGIYKDYFGHDMSWSLNPQQFESIYGGVPSFQEPGLVL